MAYNLKYSMTFDSVRGQEYSIEIGQWNYEGPATLKKLGSAPILRMEDGEAIRSTSLEFDMIADHDGDLRDFYTVDNSEFNITLWKDGRCIWGGYLVPELYEEPYVAAPYHVHVTATDGLARLKNAKYTNGGRYTIKEAIIHAIISGGRTNLTDMHVANTLHTAGIGENEALAMIDQLTINTRMYKGENSYTVLEDILSGIGCYITCKKNIIQILRYTDLDAARYDVVADIFEDPVVRPTVAPIVKTLGGIGDDTYPVNGGMTLAIQPAKRTISMDMQYKLTPGLLQHGDFDAGLGGWTASSTAIETNAWDNQHYCRIPYAPDGAAGYWIANSAGCKRTQEHLSIELEFALQSVYQRGNGKFEIWVKLVADGQTYWHSGTRWETSQQAIAPRGTLQQGRTYGSYRKPNPTRRFTVPENWEKFTLDISRIPKDGVISITIININSGKVDAPSSGTRPPVVSGNVVNLYVRNVRIFHPVAQPGKTEVTLNAKASKDAPTFTTEFIDAPFAPNADATFYNTPLLNGGITEQWKCDGIPATSLASLTLQDRASVEGVKKATLRGTIKAIDFDLLRDKFSGKFFYATAYEWDLGEDTMDVDLCEFVKAISIPEITNLNI